MTVNKNFRFKSNSQTKAIHNFNNMDNQSDNGSDFERVEPDEEQSEQQQLMSQLRQDQLGAEFTFEGSEDSFDPVEGKRQMQDKMANFHADENDHFRAEVETMKTDKHLPLELCNEMILFASCDTLANLTKLLSSSSPTGGSGDSIAFLAEKQLGIKTKLVLRNNKWHISDHKQVLASADGLTVASKTYAWTKVRAQHPVSRAMLAPIPGLKLVYWEVAMKKGRVVEIGWIGPNFPFDTEWIGEHSGSYGTDYEGLYWGSGRKVQSYGKLFGEGDVVGSGMLLTKENKFKLFFTLNGALNGKPIVVLNDSQDQLLYPAVSLLWEDTSVEANFGADSAGKPFMFDLNAHETELFGQ